MWKVAEDIKCFMVPSYTTDKNTSNINWCIYQLQYKGIAVVVITVVFAIVIIVIVEIVTRTITVMIITMITRSAAAIAAADLNTKV